MWYISPSEQFVSVLGNFAGNEGTHDAAMCIFPVLVPFSKIFY